MGDKKCLEDHSVTSEQRNGAVGTSVTQKDHSVETQFFRFRGAVPYLPIRIFRLDHPPLP
jgi:hypothetical protein